MSIANLKNETHRRSGAITRQLVDADKRTVTLSFSSEEPYERHWGVEVLDHSKDAVDLSRLNKGGAVLLEHDPNRQIGVVERAWLDGKRGKAVVRFSKNPEANEVFQDVADGIRSLVSVGYQILEAKSEGKRDGLDVVRATKWQPFEVSIVAIPADSTVGVGRSKVTTMSDTTNADYQKEVRTMLLIAKQRNRMDVFEQSMSAGEGLEAFRNRMLDAVDTMKSLGTEHIGLRLKGEPDNSIGGLIGMSAHEVQRYSFARAILGMASNKLDGLELEIHQEYAKRSGIKPKGLMIPPDVLNRSWVTRDHTAGHAPSGGYLVNTTSADFVTLLRNATRVAQLGATMLGGLVGNVSIPRQLTGTTASWVTENQENTESSATFGQLTLTPRRVSGYSEFSKQLLVQSSQAIDALIQADLAQAIGLAIDLAAISGAGNAQPLGLLNTDGINSVTFGAAPSWSKIVEFESDIEEDNALLGSLGYLVSPTTKAKLKTTLKVSGDAGGGFLWSDGNEPGMGMVNGYRAASTKQVANDRVFFGDWSQLIIGQWGGLDLQVDAITKMRQGLVGICADQFTDVIVRRAESFAVSSDSGAQ